MRQFIFIALIVSLFGCKHDSAEDLQPDMNGSIGFSTTVLSKGAATTTETISDFGVFGYHTLYSRWDEAGADALPQVFDNKKVYKTANSWEYEGDVFWGGSFTKFFSFFGYSPYATAANGIVAQATNSKGLPTITFTINEDVSKQIDLLVSTPVCDIEASNNLVLMNFQHALCRIGFKAFSTIVDTKVKSIKIVNVNSKGQLNLKNEWASDPALRDFTLSYSDIGVSSNELTPTDLSEPANHFLLLPRSYIKEQNTKIIFTYTLSGEKEFTKEYIVKEEWEKGMTVTYTVDLTEKAEDPLIVTEVTITPWEAGGTSTGNIDGQVKMVNLIYNENNATSNPTECVQNGYLVVKKLYDPTQVWNTKQDGTGVSYTYKSVIHMKSDITLYNVDNTVLIGNLRWQKTNLSNIAGEDYIFPAANPQDFGVFFQWGSLTPLQRESSIDDGLLLHRASLIPKLSNPANSGYDYLTPLEHDPCKKFHANFQSPTKEQYATLVASGMSETRTYQGVEGHFFGPDAKLCDDKTIKAGCLFFPNTMIRRHDTGMFDDSYGTSYWSSSVMSTAVDADFAHVLTLPTGVIDSRNRNTAMAVRCVK